MSKEDPSIQEVKDAQETLKNAGFFDDDAIKIAITKALTTALGTPRWQVMGVEGSPVIAVTNPGAGSSEGEWFAMVRGLWTSDDGPSILIGDGNE